MARGRSRGRKDERRRRADRKAETYKRLLILAVVLNFILAGGLLFAYFSITLAPPKKVTMTLATSSIGGVFHPLGDAMASLWTKTVPNLEVRAEPTQGSADNMKLLRDGKVDLALSTSDIAFDAAAGGAPFTGKAPLRTLMVLYTNYMHIVTWEGRGISTGKDLVGKRVSIGPQGSGTAVVGLRLLEAYGIDPEKDIVKEQLGFKESVDALKEGKIDAFFWIVGIPAAAILDYASTPGVKIRLVPNGEAVARMLQKYGPVYFLDKIPRGTYPGQDEDVDVVGVTSLLVALERLPEDMAYALVKAFFDNQKDILSAHPVVKDVKLERQQAKYSPVPFHEGAAKFYRERGVWR